MNYFNAVLLPPEKLSQKIISFAQEYFYPISNGYCLSKDILPHVTLCQFQSPHSEIEKFKIPHTYKAKFVNFHQREGEGIHKDYIWLELVVQKSASLKKVREDVIQKLQTYDYDLNVGHSYSPHLTLCRTTRDKLDNIKLPSVPNDIIKQNFDWSFAVGQSDINGQFLG